MPPTNRIFKLDLASSTSPRSEKIRLIPAIGFILENLGDRASPWISKPIWARLPTSPANRNGTKNGSRITMTVWKRSAARALAEMMVFRRIVWRFRNIPLTSAAHCSNTWAPAKWNTPSAASRMRVAGISRLFATWPFLRASDRRLPVPFSVRSCPEFSATGSFSLRHGLEQSDGVAGHSAQEIADVGAHVRKAQT